MNRLCESLKLTYEETLKWIKDTYGDSFYHYFINSDENEKERTVLTILNNLG